MSDDIVERIEACSVEVDNVMNIAKQQAELIKSLLDEICQKQLRNGELIEQNILLNKLLKEAGIEHGFNIDSTR